ncbi:MAG: glycogen/starch/alpha-glucan family phosphorylase, partial [bacterium]
MFFGKFDKAKFKEDVKQSIRTLYRKDLNEATQQEIFQAVANVIETEIINVWMDSCKRFEENQSKIVYYLSMEFLIGRAMGNNLLNLGEYDGVRKALDELGLDLNALEDQEPDPALGNGGLGRLAACFLDSLATGGYHAYGCGIRYHYGMFRQKIENGFQVEKPDNWLKNGYPFELKRPEHAKEIRFGGNTRTEFDKETNQNKYIYENYSSVLAVPYDIPILGFRNGVVNTLRIWDAEPIVGFNLSSFDRGEYAKAVEQTNLARTITEVLYPNDNHPAGKELRLKQQYFFVSASIQTALVKHLKQYNTLDNLPDKCAFQMNDTHPALAVAELMRLLLDEYHYGWDKAWELTTATCAYTNHTIMAEALEKWSDAMFSRLLPRVYQIIEEINERFCREVRQRYPGNEAKAKSMAIVYDREVRMANLAIVGGHSVNGVAALHTEILKTSVLKDFYELMPEKFNNKTNGITQRRFLLHGNRLLADWITDKIGEGWATNLSMLEQLKVYADDPRSLQEFMSIKHKNKKRLADYILEHNGIEVDPYSIFDVQVK